MPNGFGSRFPSAATPAAPSPVATVPVASPAGSFGSRFNPSAAQPIQAGPPKATGGGGLLGSIGHFVASKADLAAHDIASIPTGLAQAGTAEYKALKVTAEHPFGKLTPQQQADLHGPDKIVNATIQGVKTSFEHPLRDPFQTALNATAAASLGAGAVLRVANAADALSAGEAGGAVRALVTKPAVTPRIIQVPKVLDTEAGPTVAHEPVQLQASRNAAVRLAQKAHDAVVQRGLNASVSTDQPNAVARYGLGRVAAATNETARIAQRVRQVPIGLLQRAAAGRHAFDKDVPQKLGQLALFLKSANVTGAEAARFWETQAANGEATGDLAKLAQQAHDQGLIGLNESGNVAVNADRFPKLGNVDRLMAENQAAREATIQQHGLMTSTGAQQRLGLVAQKMGVDREGQGFTSLKTAVKRPPQSAFAASRGPVVGEARGFVGSKAATGKGVETGVLPDNTTAGVIAGAREALRFENTVEHRRLVARYGSDFKQSGQDVLIRDPTVAKKGDITDAVRESLGQLKSTVGTISDEDYKTGLAAAIKAHVDDAFGRQFNEGRSMGVGQRAPEGYKFVHEKLLGDLARETTPRTGLTKGINTVNSAITAATVYFKIGHLPTRTFTNAFTNIVQGSAKPAEIGDSVRLWKQLSYRERQEALAATGQHGYAAMPHEGTNVVARVAGRGADWWARHIDAPFRFNALAYEARKAGITTPEQFRDLLKHAADPAAQGKNAAETARYDWVMRRANRASIMYDGLNASEKRFLTRAFWFYPWTKGATRFAFHTVSEHPFKAQVGGALGAQGRQTQQQLLGQVPSYEYGLLPLGGGANPLTTNLSTFTPYGTAGNIAELVARPGETLRNLNPAFGAAVTATSGIDQYGNRTKTPLTSALAQLVSPTPEAQIADAFLHKPKPTQMFRKTPGSSLARAFGGAAVPRRVNRAALNKSAQREKTGR